MKNDYLEVVTKQRISTGLYFEVRDGSLGSADVVVKTPRGATCRFGEETIDILTEINGIQGVPFYHGLTMIGPTAGLVFEKLEGRTFDERMKPIFPEPGLDWREAKAVMIAVLKILKPVHAKRIVHGDIKFRNIFLRNNGAVSLLDWDNARVIRGSESHERARLLGTLLYMSPEQIRDEHVDQRSDYYSLGAVIATAAYGPKVLSLYELGADKVLKKRESPEVIRKRISAGEGIKHQIFPSAKDALEEAFQTALRAMTRVKRDDRPATAEDILKIVR